MSKAPEIIIVGRGIAELTLALALFEVGIRARVFESASESRELGVGINVLPHATKEFERLGILNRLTNSGLELERYIWFNRFGQEIFSEARGLRAGYEWPQVAIHRGIFHRILFDTV
ncbi:MAG: 2-polyprenyl-6-methoxyphenol hydroxylase-like FAD-dependent oxidoreductase, partial [Gammaproteobacteria bacterium]